MKIKYITFIDNDGIDMGIIFPEIITHSAFASRYKIEHKDLIGAGFAHIKEKDGLNYFEAFGESISLSLKSNKKDSEILTMNYFGFESLCFLNK